LTIKVDIFSLERICTDW